MNLLIRSVAKQRRKNRDFCEGSITKRGFQKKKEEAVICLNNNELRKEELAICI